MKRKQPIEKVRRDLALRYRLIETVAWWEGRLTTEHLMQSFGISCQQASRTSTPTSQNMRLKILRMTQNKRLRAQ
jgi:hypothetical protein